MFLLKAGSKYFNTIDKNQKRGQPKKITFSPQLICLDSIYEKLWTKGLLVIRYNILKIRFRRNPPKAGSKNVEILQVRGWPGKITFSPQLICADSIYENRRTKNLLFIRYTRCKTTLCMFLLKSGSKQFNTIKK